tara:strand:+ start:239 stop:463 length:225 start_codon:yes stop_codon:yes gene_type:complete
MKLDPNSQIALHKLVGAYITRPDHARFIINSFSVEVRDPAEILVEIEDATRTEGPTTLAWSALKDWTLKLPKEN